MRRLILKMEEMDKGDVSEMEEIETNLSEESETVDVTEVSMA